MNLNLSLTTVLLVVAFVLFVLAGTRLARGWMLPWGLACWVAVQVIGRF